MQVFDVNFFFVVVLVILGTIAILSSKPKKENKELKQGQQWKENDNPFDSCDCATILAVQDEWVKFEVLPSRSLKPNLNQSCKANTFRALYPVFVGEIK